MKPSDVGTPKHPITLITPDEAAVRLGLDKVAKSGLNAHRVVLAMARRGDIRGVRVGKWTMIDPRSVDAIITGNFARHAPGY